MATINGATLPLPNLSTWLSTLACSALTAGRPEVRQARPRVLVVDDESALCELLSIYLGQKGLEVATVRTADGARTLVERGQFDLVILDWKLDGVEGLDLLHLSKARHPEIPVIIFTGSDLNEGSLGRGLACEADAIVRKMGPLDALATAVLQQLNRCQTQARDAA
jgi:DNA-binding response OmpR family regulator